MPTVTRQAPAKINLDLRVLRQRPDGFHELRTIFQTISLADQLTIDFDPSTTTRVEVQCPGRADLETDENFAARAARNLLEYCGVQAHVDIRIDKNIPSGAGLGGGSSDAAAVLLTLAELIEPAPSHQALVELGANIGSDVPFFLIGGTALGIGKGDEIYPLPNLPAHSVVVVMPDIAVSTPWAYREYAKSTSSKLTADSELRTISSFCSAIRVLEADGVFEFAGLIANDFEQTVFRQYPPLETIKQQLVATGARIALMSGSGSALFGIFESEAEAKNAVQTFAAEGLRAVDCRFVTRNG